METWLYVIVICIVFVGIISFFAIRNIAQKKRVEKFKNDRNVYGGDMNFEQLVTDSYSGGAVKVNDYEDADSYELYSLDEPAVDHHEEKTNDYDDDDDNAFLDAKFAEYEKYLRENMNFDDEDEEDNFEHTDNGVNMPEADDGFDDFDLDKIVEDLDEENVKTSSRKRKEIYAEYGFDIDAMKGKSAEEIAEVVKRLPANVQEMVLTDILSRKNFDDEED